MANSKACYRFSVKEMVQFCLNQGDASASLHGPASAEEGRQAQQRLQALTLMKQHPEAPQYETEVSVQQLYEFADFDLNVRGRIDGLCQADEVLFIEEIKATRHAQHELPLAQRVQHRWQALIYAALRLSAQPAKQCHLRVRYWHIQSERAYQVDETISAEHLLSEYQTLLDSLCKWLERVTAHRQARNEALTSAGFPFAHYRQGQRELAVQIYRTLEQERRLIAHAATGLGKSVTTLFPALKALAHLERQQVWYLTAKRSGRRAVFQTLDLPSLRSIPIKALELPARQQVCPCANSTDAGLTPCHRQIGYFERRHVALNALFDHSAIHADTLTKIAEQYDVCPSLLARDALPWTDVIVGDFNQVFDLAMHPADYLQLRGRHALLLVDEAHNLPERARDSYQARIDSRQLTAVLNLLPKNALLKRRVQRLKRWLTEQGRQSPSPIIATDDKLPDKFLQLLGDNIDALQQWLASQATLFVDDLLIDWLFCLLDWQRLASYWGAHMQLELVRGDNGRAFYLVARCLDPAPILTRLQARFSSAVFFSGSLLPLRYFQLCLLEENGAGIQTINIDSPFDPTRLGVFVAPLNTRLQQRELSLPDLHNYLLSITSCQPGRYLVCCPSYPYLEAISEFCAQSEQWSNWQLLTQTPNDVDATNQILAQMNQASSALAFVIMGGSLAEGIELEDTGLQGVIIIGTGMPPPDSAREWQRRYWQQRTGRGFDFAYRYPGMQRIIQSAGRIQRRDTDRGVVILLEERFYRHHHQQPFPSHWQPIDCATPVELAQRLVGFWQHHTPRVTAPRSALFPPLD